eukprot:1036093-Amphidinium_carterae.1
MERAAGPATGTPTWRESVHHGVSQLRPTGTTATTGKSVALSLSPTLTGAAMIVPNPFHHKHSNGVR